ncbi:MAG: ABC transporter substrate binding protein [Geobacteraceae bacterium]|nr:ABC transporter substrate binding protein [Geobacteraceae bacterium]
MAASIRFAKIYFLLWLLVGLLPAAADAAGIPKVLVVMSYHEGMPWENEIRQGIDESLQGACEIRYVYLNTKNDFAGGSRKAEEAWRIFQQFRPDGVLAADDDAQALFVVPYLKDKVQTPVVFCGVNAGAGSYGYPASNVTGILERAHFRESVTFLQQLVPGARSVGFMTNDTPTGRAYAEQIRQESSSYPLKAYSVRLVTTLAEAVTVAEAWKDQYDALFLIAMDGLSSYDGKPLAEKESFHFISRAFEKPVLGINEFNVREGLLCSVAKTGWEQGASAAAMLQSAMAGTPVRSIPIIRNLSGKRVLNITVMKSLNIKPKPALLVGTELVETEE